MMSLHLLLLAIAISGTSAVLCDFYRDSTRRGYRPASNQEELEAYYAGCTEIRGTIEIANNYTGRFYLPNVTSISDGIATMPRRWAGTPSPMPLLTSIEFPDLNDTDEIIIINAPALTTISFPNLTVLNNSLFIAGIEDCHVNFPSLKSATYSLDVTGNSNKLDFPRLTTVGALRVSRNPVSEFDTHRRYLLVDRVNQIPLDISFPALREALSIYFQGSISSLSMPLLSNLRGEFYADIRILTHGNPLNISIPNLSTASHISAAGTIGSMSFPLLNSTEFFEVNTSTPLNITLEPLQHVLLLNLYGNITALSLSSITELNVAEIISEVEGFDCGPFYSIYERVNGDPPNPHNCRGPIYPPKDWTSLKLGLGIGLGVPLFLAIAYFVFWKRRKTIREQKLKANKPPEYELGLPPTYATDGPPTYDASQGEPGSEQRAADVAGARTGDGSDARGEDAGENNAGDATSARPEDGSSAHREGTLGSRIA
ncbi:hypothetical protein V492_03254 [Pseudogymnoascus sp. VKM F-4246]|nr:hypothetical protein V492_03254 [Pseudogymnoascus sp. VKM F-4246]